MTEATPSSDPVPGPASGDPADAAGADPLAAPIREDEVGKTLAAVLKARLGIPWSEAQRLCERGKVFVNGDGCLDPVRRVRSGARLELRRAAKTPLSAEKQAALACIVHEDSQVVVIDKPEGVMSVPYERGDTGTAMDLVRLAWRAQGRHATAAPLHIVHRIDKDTSGLLMFAKTRHAERSLQARFRAHDIERQYLCVVHGRLTDRRVESYFIDDRGDGLRGSLRGPQGFELTTPPPKGTGKRAVTHFKAIEFFADLATLCAVTIETGKTHQIRIHAAENGHPVIGETVYIRDFLRRGHTPIESPRLLLHAETLGLIHPTTGEPVRLRSQPPPEFEKVLRRLRRMPPAAASPAAPSAQSRNKT